MEVFDYDIARFAADMRMVCNNFGLLVDLSYFPTTYETFRFVVQALRPYITRFHVGNAVVKPGCEAYGDMHPRFGFPDSAYDTLELVDFFCVLKEEGFFSKNHPYVLSFEVKPWGRGCRPGSGRKLAKALLNSLVLLPKVKPPVRGLSVAIHVLDSDM